MASGIFKRLEQSRWFRREVEAMWQRLYRMAYSWCHDPHLAADLVQDTMAKALKNRHQLRDRAALTGWLFVILTNSWRDHCRHVRDTVDIDTMELGHDSDLETDSDRNALLQRVRTAMARLSPDHRQVLTLVVLEGMAYDEVARVLGIPIGTVTSRLCRAREILRRNLHQMGVAGATITTLRRVQ
ncbi:MAG: sigma-70 family RNA polymerase sigma factor [Gammaproteobacteria bacterium]|nr:sigma-70 family RNA polymerase sigma factor [Gammaproteobacteria bacterium]